jgi:hypothetical protein
VSPPTRPTRLGRLVRIVATVATAVVIVVALMWSVRRSSPPEPSRLQSAASSSTPTVRPSSLEATEAARAPTTDAQTLVPEPSTRRSAQSTGRSARDMPAEEAVREPGTPSHAGPASPLLNSALALPGPTTPTVAEPPLVAPLPLAPPPAATVPVPAPMTLSPPALPVVAAERDPQVSAIRDVLSLYERAYRTLDVRAAAEVWPSVDAAGLTRIFSRLREQDLRLEACLIDIVREHATAECAGTLQYVPRVGDSTARTERRSWQFQLDRRGGRWQIASILAR